MLRSSWLAPGGGSSGYEELTRQLGKGLTLQEAAAPTPEETRSEGRSGPQRQ